MRSETARDKGAIFPGYMRMMLPQSDKEPDYLSHPCCSRHREMWLMGVTLRPEQHSCNCTTAAAPPMISGCMLLTTTYLPALSLAVIATSSAGGSEQAQAAHRHGAQTPR